MSVCKLVNTMGMCVCLSGFSLFRFLLGHCFGSVKRRVYMYHSIYDICVDLEKIVFFFATRYESYLSRSLARSLIVCMCEDVC